MEKQKLIVCVALCLVMGTGAWAAIGDGLISHWSFNENAGLTAGDSVGGNTGTLMGGTSWTAGKFGSALDFDGIDGYVDAGNDASLMPANVTVSAWIKVEGYGYYGQIAGMAGAYGNVGAVIYLVIFSLVDAKTFFFVLSGGALVSFIITWFLLDEPEGAFSESVDVHEEVEP